MPWTILGSYCTPGMRDLTYWGTISATGLALMVVVGMRDSFCFLMMASRALAGSLPWATSFSTHLSVLLRFCSCENMFS